MPGGISVKNLLLKGKPVRKSASFPSVVVFHPFGISPSSESSKLSGEEVGDFFGQAGFAASDFGADRVEVDKPALENGLGHLLQRAVHLPVQLDLVVEAFEDRTYSFLHFNARQDHL